VARWRTEPVVLVAEVVVFGVRYRLPFVRQPRSTILAVNLGGAVIEGVFLSGLAAVLLVGLA
jgi:uncharacterized membrane protein